MSFYDLYLFVTEFSSNFLYDQDDNYIFKSLNPGFCVNLKLTIFVLDFAL